MPTDHALSSAGCTMHSPTTPPRKRLPPNTRAEESATSTGRDTKAVPDTIFKKLNQSAAAKAGITLPSASRMPVSRPAATMAGRMGTNTSPSVFTSRCGSGSTGAVHFCAAGAPGRPDSFINSSYTRFTVPVPRMI